MVSLDMVNNPTTSATDIDNTSCFSEDMNFILEDEIEARRWLWGSTDALIFKVVLPCIVSTCVLGNVAFLFTVIRLPRMNTITNLYLCHLAIADIFFVVFSAGSYTWVYSHSLISSDSPLESSIECYMIMFPVVLCYFASVEIVTLVSMERYYAICKPMKHRVIEGKSRSRKFLGCTWLLAAILSGICTPRFGSFKKGCLFWPDMEEFKHLSSSFQDCFKVSSEWFVLSETIQMLAFIIAFIASVFSYVNIIRALNDRDIDGDTKQELSAQNKSIRNQVARMLVINGAIFFVCQTPFRFVAVNSILQERQGAIVLNKDPLGSLLTVIGRALLFLNSSINPYLYALSSSFYRTAFREALCGKSRALTGASTLTSTAAQSTEISKSNV